MKQTIKITLNLPNEYETFTALELRQLLFDNVIHALPCFYLDQILFMESETKPSVKAEYLKWYEITKKVEWSLE